MQGVGHRRPVQGCDTFLARSTHFCASSLFTSIWLKQSLYTTINAVQTAFNSRKSSKSVSSNRLVSCLLAHDQKDVKKAICRYYSAICRSSSVVKGKIIRHSTPLCRLERPCWSVIGSALQEVADLHWTTLYCSPHPPILVCCLKSPTAHVDAGIEVALPDLSMPPPLVCHLVSHPNRFLQLAFQAGASFTARVLTLVSSHEYSLIAFHVPHQALISYRHLREYASDRQ